MKVISNNRGDTIVEVLISIAVLSLVLAASYSLSNLSSQHVRAAQERAEALKLTEAQMERLRIFVGSGGIWGSNKCFSSVDNAPTSADSECGFGSENRYKITISGPDANNTYKASATWYNVINSGQDNLAISLRIYQ